MVFGWQRAGFPQPSGADVSAARPPQRRTPPQPPLRLLRLWAGDQPDVLDIFRIIFVSAKPVSQATLSDYAFKIDIPLLNSFIDKVVLAGTGVQTAMQTIIVAAEILIGLSLIGGLFSTLSSAVSIVLMAMFVTTTGLYLTTFWMFFGAIAVLFGAGTVFGLDYYAAPLLKRLWTRLGWVRRLYICD